MSIFFQNGRIRIIIFEIRIRNTEIYIYMFSMKRVLWLFLKPSLSSSNFSRSVSSLATNSGLKSSPLVLYLPFCPFCCNDLTAGLSSARSCLSSASCSHSSWCSLASCTVLIQPIARPTSRPTVPSKSSAIHTTKFRMLWLGHNIGVQPVEFSSNRIYNSA